MIRTSHIQTVETGNLVRVDADTVQECDKHVDDFCKDKAKKQKSKIELHAGTSTVLVDGRVDSSATRRHGMPPTSAVLFSFEEFTSASVRK